MQMKIITVSETVIFSRVIRKLIEEDSSWKDIVQDYEISPADGIRGAGNYRQHLMCKMTTTSEQHFKGRPITGMSTQIIFCVTLLIFFDWHKINYIINNTNVEALY